MYTVIGAIASRAMRVVWMLEELEQPYTLIPAPPRSPEVIAHNPDGKIPALLVDNVTLTDSVAITQFLADRHGALTFAAGTLERARQDALTQFCVDEIEGALWTAAKNTFVHPEAHRVPAVKETCRYEFALALERLERRLGDGPFVMGETITVPDILLGHCSGWARAAKFDIPDGPVRDYFRRLVARPAFQRADRHRAP
jgi:glutathione S-transferase